MNEDLHGGEFNCELGYNGIIMVLKDIEPGGELLTRYGDRYDWDHLKEDALTAMREEFNFWIKGVDMDWDNMVEARKSKRHLVKWAVKLLDGKVLHEDMHAVVNGHDWEGEMGAIAFLTSGITYEKYGFKNWGKSIMRQEE